MGFYSEITYEYNLYPNVFLESGIGYFHDGVSNGNDVRGVPVTFTLKGVYPLENVDNLEAFAGAGLGIYFTKYDGVLNGSDVDDTDTVFGGHLLIGADYGIAPNMCIGIEGKYVVTGDASYDGVEADLDGFAVLARLGLRL
jgi:opacity protein-like surface antigen